MLTPEQKAARDAERAAKRAARAEQVKKLPNTADGEKMALAMEGIVQNVDERFEDTDESLTVVRDDLKSIKADMEKVIAQARTRKSGKANTEGMDVKAFNIGKMAIAFHAKGMGPESADTVEGIGAEIDVCVEASKGYKNLTRKDILTSLTGLSGGFPLATQIRDSIMEAGRSQSALWQMGIVNDNLEGLSDFAVPFEVNPDGTNVTTGANLTTHSSQEGGAVGASVRPGFKLAKFTPRQMDMMIGLTQQYLKLGGGFVNDFVNRIARKDFMTKLERMCLTGRGQQESEPMGLINRTDLTDAGLTNAIGTDGRFLSPTDLKDFEMALAEVDRLTDSCSFLTRPAALKGFAHEVHHGFAGATESESAPRTPVALMAFEKMAAYLGFNMKRTTNVPNNIKQGATLTTTAMLYGDWSHVYIPFWGPMEIEMSRQATVGGVSAFESFLIYVRFMQMYDSNIVDPVAMIKQTGFKTV